MRLAVIGAGCVGSVLAARLHDAGCEVALIAKGDRGRRLAAEGLVVNGIQYSLPVCDSGTMSNSKFDLVFVCVKNYQLDIACTDLKDCIDEHTILLPLLNSISPTSVISSYYPENEVLYGYISKIDSQRSGRGFVYNLAGDVHFGRACNQGYDSLLASFKGMLASAGFNAFIDEDMVKGIWKKWMLNVGANQVSALTEANYIQFSSSPEIEEVLRMAMGELLCLAQKETVGLVQDDADELVHYLMTYPFPKKTSMLQDVLAKRKTEVEAISGDVLRLSEKWNYPCPVNKTMYCLIRGKEQTYLKVEDQ